MLSHYQIIATAAVIAAVILAAYLARRFYKTVSVVASPLLIFGLLIILLFGCTPKAPDAELHIPDESHTAKASSSSASSAITANARSQSNGSG